MPYRYYWRNEKTWLNLSHLGVTECGKGRKEAGIPQKRDFEAGVELRKSGTLIECGSLGSGAGGDAGNIRNEKR